MPKNYIFAGSHKDARGIGMQYSLLGACKMKVVEPYAWHKDFLFEIADHPVSRITELFKAPVQKKVGCGNM